MSPQNRVDTLTPPPPPPHTAADTPLVTTYAGSRGTLDTVWPVSGLMPMDLKIFLYNLWVTGNTITTVVKRQEDK